MGSGVILPWGDVSVSILFPPLPKPHHLWTCTNLQHAVVPLLLHSGNPNYYPSQQHWISGVASEKLSDMESNDRESTIGVLASGCY